MAARRSPTFACAATVIAGFAIAAAACGDNAPGAADAAIAIDAARDAADVGSGFVEAPHATAPQVLSGGGAVLASPEIVPIFFAGDDVMQGQVDEFLANLATSSYWQTTTGEYGVGPPTILPTIVSTDTPPTTDDALQAFIEAHIEPSPEDPLPGRSAEQALIERTPPATLPPWPLPTVNSIYIVFLPTGVTLTGAGLGTSCVDFGGYHYELPHGGPTYALIPRCGSGIDDVSAPTSHELIEASTDPHPDTAPAFIDIDQNDLVWEYTPGAELGDMCEYVQAAFQRLIYHAPLGSTRFLVQRTWSNASAAAGHDPCVPVLDQPYAAAAPVFGNVALDYGGGTAMTTGVEVPVGGAAVIPLQLFSDAPTPAWTIHVDDVPSTLQSLPAELDFTLDRSSGSNGDIAHLIIVRLRTGTGGGSELVVTSKVGDQVVSLWWGLVTN